MKITQIINLLRIGQNYCSLEALDITISTDSVSCNFDNVTKSYALAKLTNRLK